MPNNEQQRAAGTPAPACSLSDLVRQFDKLVCAKWHEIRATKGNLISVWNPRLTDCEDSQRRDATRTELMRWAREWFLQRGHNVECVPNPHNTDGFAIEEANKGVTVAAPAAGDA